MRDEKVGAVIVAAGQSQRMGGVDKVFADLGGTPMIVRVIEAFQECGAIDKIVVVLKRGNVQRVRETAKENGWSKLKDVCLGGPRRQDSVKQGLNKLKGCQWVVIHDGARPLVTSTLIIRGLAVARLTNAAVAAVPVKDTIKWATPGGFVRVTPSRDTLWAVQTPQVFRYELIRQAHDLISEDVNDDSTMVERIGHEVKLFMGSHRNIKITTPEDLALAQIMLERK